MSGTKFPTMSTELCAVSTEMQQLLEIAERQMFLLRNANFNGLDVVLVVSKDLLPTTDPTVCNTSFGPVPVDVVSELRGFCGVIPQTIWDCARGLSSAPWYADAVEVQLARERKRARNGRWD